MRPVRKPWWQQATALVTVSTGGVITGLNFIPGAATTMTSPTSVPLHLLALEQAGQPGTLGNLAAGGDSAASATSDAQLRAAIVNVAGYYLRLASGRTPAQMEALIWDNTSSDGADHGESCAAFASLTLELAAQAVGQQSWVTGGSSYPWPLPEWADVRVDTNPASPNVTSMVADAHRHGRWHPLGDGYQPRPGDWVLYEGHVEVVTSYANGVLDTIGADSLPRLTVNAHSLRGQFAAQGVTGFVDNGQLKAAPTTTTGTTGSGGTPGVTAGDAAAKGARGTRRRGEGRRRRKGGAGRGGGKNPPLIPGTAAVPGIPATGALGAFAGRAGADGTGPAGQAGDQGRRSGRGGRGCRDGRRRRWRGGGRARGRSRPARGNAGHRADAGQRGPRPAGQPAGRDAGDHAGRDAGQHAVARRLQPGRPGSTPRRVPGTSRRSSAWSRRGRSPPSSGTACPRRSRSRRPSRSRRGGAAVSPRSTTTCSASREPGRRAA